MSQEWVDLVREGFEALQRGEMAMFDGMTTPDLVLVQPPEVPDAKTYEGRDAIAEAMEDWPKPVGGLPHGPDRNPGRGR